MRKKTRVIQISGLKGLFLSIFVVICLAAGFIAFPSLAAMYLWNKAAEFVAIPAINIVQGLLLWAIVAITGFILNDKHKYLSTFNASNKLSEAELKSILDKAKLQAQARALDSMLLKSGKPIEKREEEKEKENV